MNIEYLKRAIKRTYKRYIGERTDAKATLMEVANFFNIPIDENRVSDYEIKSIDYNVPSIELIDTKNEIHYNANYTCDAELLNSYGGPMIYNSLTSISPIVKTESLYYIGEQNFIISKMTFMNERYELVFEKENPNFDFCQDGQKLLVQYSKYLNYDGKEEKQQLLTKIYKCYEEDTLDDEFEQSYTYGYPDFIEYKNTQDKYTYVRKNGIVYGINKLKKDNNHLMGVCVENISGDIRMYLPYDLCTDEYQNFPDKANNSVIIFRGITDDDIKDLVQICKTNYGIEISYFSEKMYFEPDFYTQTNIDEKFNLPILTEGNITAYEIQNIISFLQIKFANNQFVEIVLEILEEFKTKIEIKNGIIKEELDDLSPKLLFDKSFEEIYSMISSNKDEYFDLISRQFKETVNGINNKKVKVLLSCQK